MYVSMTMSSFTRSGITILLLLLKIYHVNVTSGADTLGYLTCLNASGQRNKTIRCGNSERIHVRSTVIAVLPEHLPCTEEEVLPFLRYNVTDSCKFHDPLAFTRCHGKQLCDLPPSLAERSFNRDICQNSYERYITSVLYIRYSCVIGITENIAVVPMHGNLIGTTFQIYSPFYPCFVPSTQFKLQCQLGIQSMPTDSIHVNVQARSLGYESHSNHCVESLSITKEDIPRIRHEWFKLCINDTVSEYETRDTLNEYWNLTYSKSSLTAGGRFWLTIEAEKDLLLSCDNRELSQSLSFSDSELYAKRLSDNCAFSRGPPTKIRPLEGNSTINDDDNTNGGNYAAVFGVTGSLLALLIVLGIVILIILRRTSFIGRKKKKSAQSEHGFVRNGTLPNSYCNVETKTTSAIITKSMENKRHGTEEMYAVVNKHKIVNSKNQDDIVMYENDDLYEASAAEGKGNQDPKHLDTKNSGAEDETFMYENNDIYSS